MSVNFTKGRASILVLLMLVGMLSGGLRCRCDTYNRPGSHRYKGSGHSDHGCPGSHSNQSSSRCDTTQPPGGNGRGNSKPQALRT